MLVGFFSTVRASRSLCMFLEEEQKKEIKANWQTHSIFLMLYLEKIFNSYCDLVTCFDFLVFFYSLIGTTCSAVEFHRAPFCQPYFAAYSMEIWKTNGSLE